jgi:DNA mismatch repair protein MutL
MSHRIQQLAPQVVNRIAAGEVIERPASVVKELLENSVDALATRIEVDISAGGTELIRISDNGEGIHPDDLLLAVTSHATSKISSDADLDHVATLGFRGEALASIASVSRFRIRTRQAGEAVGRELESQGGEIGVNRNCGCPEGTIIEVHNLFFNTPARRKFMKKASTEFGHISEQFTRLALANPCLHLVLKHNDKLVYELPGTSDQLERIRRFFGGEIADKLIAVESETQTQDGQTIRLWGYVGEPSLSKSTRKSQYLFLNGRWIQDRSLQHALGEAYRGLLMVGRHPVSFLFLELPPHLVDVNVHPTKTEVRFQDSQSLYRQLLHTLRNRFLSMDFQSQIHVPTRNQTDSAAGEPTAMQKELNIWATSATESRPPQIGMPPQGSQSWDTPSTEQTTRTPTLPQAFRSTDAATHVAAVDSPVSDPADLAAPSIDQTSTTSQTTTATFDDTSPAVSDLPDTIAQPDLPSSTDSSAQPAHDIEAALNAAASQTAAGAAPTAGNEFRAFQIHDCYLVVANDEGLEVIDQHALHERILYEHLRLRVLGEGVERQKLLIPEAVECSAGEAAVLIEHQELLKQAGFELEEFGGTTVLLTAHPVLLPRGNFVRILRDLAEQLEKTDGKTSRRDLLDNMLHTMACRAAIKAGQRLAPEEMQELLRQRHLVDDAHHCPHGRPTSLMLSRMTLDKQFGRLG